MKLKLQPVTLEVPGTTEARKGYVIRSQVLTSTNVKT